LESPSLAWKRNAYPQGTGQSYATVIADILRRINAEGDEVHGAAQTVEWTPNSAPSRQSAG